MSEQLPHHGAEKNEHLELKPVEAVKHTAEKRAEIHHHAEKPDIEQIKHRAEAEAKSGKEITVESGKDSQANQHHLVSSSLRQDSLKRTLKKTRKHLTSAERALSKAVHQPVIDAISKVGANTIARPNGILAGSIIALAGSSYLLYSAKRYGFEYNYWVMFLLFAGGYVAGLIVETLFYLLRRSTRSSKY